MCLRTHTHTYVRMHTTHFYTNTIAGTRHKNLGSQQKAVKISVVAMLVIRHTWAGWWYFL